MQQLPGLSATTPSGPRTRDDVREAFGRLPTSKVPVVIELPVTLATSFRDILDPLGSWRTRLRRLRRRVGEEGFRPLSPCRAGPAQAFDAVATTRGVLESRAEFHPQQAQVV